MSDLKHIKISGELFWTKWMAEFNTRFKKDNNRYECTIGNISDEDAAKLTSLGIRVKYKDSMGNHIVGKSKFLFNTVDMDGNNVALDTLGNGSKCKVELSSYKHQMSSMHGNAPSIKKVTVTEVKTYVPDAKQEDDDIL